MKQILLALTLTLVALPAFGQAPASDSTVVATLAGSMTVADSLRAVIIQKDKRISALIEEIARLKGLLADRPNPRDAQLRAERESRGVSRSRDVQRRSDNPPIEYRRVGNVTLVINNTTSYDLQTEVKVAGQTLMNEERPAWSGRELFNVPQGACEIITRRIGIDGSRFSRTTFPVPAVPTTIIVTLYGNGEGRYEFFRH
jgi:hypothetical protein